mgnify:FL=1
MKILFDHQIFDYVFGGAVKYFVKLLCHLPQENWECTAIASSSEYIKRIALMKYLPYKFRGQTVLMEYQNRPYTNRVIRKGQFDVFHQTNFGTYCLESLGNKPMVTTYHDSNLSTIDPHPEIVERQRISLERANAIVCVSNNTKTDMLNLFHLDAQKVKVIYHGITRPDLNVIPAQRVINEDYILYVGRRSAYKNFRNFIVVFSELHLKYSRIKVVCTSNEFSKEEILQFKDLGIEDSMIHIAADETTMLRLYRDALFFAFPSFYEGFGMPILEAWSCGCPVVLSDASCFPEIAGNGGLFFNPKSREEMLHQFNALLFDSCLREKLVSNGYERLKQFSWEKCAEEHMQLYRTLLH